MKTRLLTPLTPLLFTIFFIFCGLMIALFFRPFYYYEIDRLHIEQTSGFSKEEIIENYDALIDYCSPFYTGELKFPTFPASKEGLIHFTEVKNIFVAIFWCGILSGILLIFIIIQKKKANENKYLLISSILSIILPLVIGLASFINFDKLFILFHKLMFRNDYWIFSEETDPVITILPEQFFMDCAIIIAATVIIGSLSLFFIYRFQLYKQRS